MARAPGWVGPSGRRGVAQGQGWAGQDWTANNVLVPVPVLSLLLSLLCACVLLQEGGQRECVWILRDQQPEEELTPVVTRCARRGDEGSSRYLVVISRQTIYWCVRCL